MGHRRCRSGDKGDATKVARQKNDGLYKKLLVKLALNIGREKENYYLCPIYNYHAHTHARNTIDYEETTDSVCSTALHRTYNVRPTA